MKKNSTEPPPHRQDDGEAHRPPPHVRGYDLLRCVGRGSYGEVWLARALEGGFLAIKVVRRCDFENDRPYEREYSGIQKFQPISRLHASQVAVLEVGRNDVEKFFFYSMELADSQDAPGAAAGDHPLDPIRYEPRTLKSDLRLRGRLPYQECLRLGMALANALDHLHSHGLVHRDIKPSNVIFVRGIPKLADIGLVTDVGATMTHVGTEGFVPPEGPGTPSADIYALGKVLYELATGMDRLQFPEFPTLTADASIHPDFLEMNQVCLTACQNDPTRRYATARDLLADLALLHSGGSVRNVRRAKERAARMRQVLVVVLLIAFVLGGAWFQAGRIKDRRNQESLAKAARELGLQREAARDANQSLAVLSSHRARTAAGEGDAAGAALWASRASRVAPLPDDQSRFSLEAAHYAATILPLRSIFLTGAPLLELSPIAGAPHVLAWLKDGNVARLDPSVPRQAPALIASLAQGPFVPQVHPMGDLLAVLDAQGRLRSIHTLSGQVREFTHEPPARLLLADPTARSVLTVSGEDRLDHWDVQQGRRLSTLMVGRKVTSAQFHPKGDRVLVGSADGIVEVLSLSENKVVGQAMHHGAALRQVLWFSDGGRLLTVGGPQVRFWEAASTQLSPVRLVHSSDIRHVALFPDGARGVSLSNDGEMKVWDAISGELLGPVLKADVNALSLSVSPDGLFIGVGSADGLTLWTQGVDRLWTVRSRHPGWDGSWIFSRNSLEVWVSRTDGVVVQLDLVEQARTVPPLDGAWVELVAGREFAGDRLEPLSLERMTAHRHRWMTALDTESPPASLPERHAQRAEVLSGRQQWFAANHHWSQAVAGDPLRREWKDRRDEALSSLRSGRVIPDPADLPARAPALSANQVDLSKWFNAGLSNAWLGGSGNDLRELVAAGLPQRSLAFDLRGVVQLGSPASDNLGRSFPRSVEGIRIGKRALRLQFLHAAAWDAIHRTRIGSYRIRYQDGESREVDLLFGENIGNWWCAPQSSRRFGAAAVVWQGSNEASRNVGMEIRVFQMAWINPKPDQIIDSIDFIAAGESSAPFLIALSLE